MLSFIPCDRLAGTVMLHGLLANILHDQYPSYASQEAVASLVTCHLVCTFSPFLNYFPSTQLLFSQDCTPTEVLIHEVFLSHKFCFKLCFLEKPVKTGM